MKFNLTRHNIFPPSQKGYHGTLATSTHVGEIVDKFSFQKKKTFLKIQHFLSKNFFFEEKQKKLKKIKIFENNIISA